MPSPIKQVSLASINVRDAEAAIAFWCDALGFEVQRDEPYGEGARWVELVPPGAETGLTLTTPDNELFREPGGFGALIFATDDIDAAHGELSARGVAFAGPVVRMGGGPPPMAFFSDPDGTQYLLVER